MHYSKQKFEDFIINSRSILNISTRTKSIREAVGNFGYTEERLAEGQRLYDELVEIARLQEEKEEEKKICFDRKSSFQAKVSNEYMKYLKIARIVFNRDDEAFMSLSLKGQRERTYDKWYHQVSVFCNNLLANSGYISKMNTFGVKKNDIEKLRDDLSELQRFVEECTRISASVKKLVKDKKTSMIKWQEWLSNYIKIVRIALQGVSAENRNSLNRLLSQGD
jgi:hypothetical protein